MSEEKKQCDSKTCSKESCAGCSSAKGGGIPKEFSRKIAIFVAYYNKDIPAINGQHRSRTEYKRYEIQ